MNCGLKTKITGKKLSNCPECSSDKIVEGIVGGFGGVVFNPDYKIWYKNLSVKGIRTRRNATCCAICGLAWMNLKPGELRDLIISVHDNKFASKIYDFEKPDYSNHVDCVNCGSKLRISGKLISSDYDVLFKPNNLKLLKKISKFTSVFFVHLESTSDCCTNCGLITSRINPDRLNRFLLRYCKPGYLVQFYSYKA